LTGAPPLGIAAPSPCPTPTTDNVLFTTDFLPSFAGNVTDVKGTITNRSSWALTGIVITVGPFGTAVVADKILSPGQTTSWSLRVGGLFESIPTQLTFQWVFPNGCPVMTPTP
jgi:hypothetical protein